MVDRIARRRLAELVRHVVTGQISKDSFLATAEEVVGSSEDDGLAAVCAAVDAIYADVSALLSVRFRGLFRLRAEVRHRMAIAALFLYSDAEYKWPPVAGPRGAYLDCLLAFACGAFIFAGLFLLIASVIYAWFAVASAGCVITAVQLYWVAQQLTTRCRAQWEEAQANYGDYDVWPFLRRADFDKARRHPPLLCGNR